MTASQPRRRWLLGLVLVAGLFGQACPLEDAIDKALKQLQSVATNIDQITQILNGLKNNLDDGTYKRQVEAIIAGAGQVAQITGQGAFDFVRDRVTEDLENMKRKKKGLPPIRHPATVTSVNQSIDFVAADRSEIKLAGWNLTQLSIEPTRYSVWIENERARRRVEDRYITVQGDYALAINVSANGVRLQEGDIKMVFDGFTSPVSVSIINAEAGIYFDDLFFDIKTDRDNKDDDIRVGIRLDIQEPPTGSAEGQRQVYLDQSFGDTWTWDKGITVRALVVPSAAAHLMCALNALRTWGLGQLPNHTREYDPTCSYTVIEPRIANLPGKNGHRKATLTVETLQDGSGWGAYINLTGTVRPTNGPAKAPEKLPLLSTDLTLFNREGSGSRAKWDFKW